MATVQVRITPTARREEDGKHYVDYLLEDLTNGGSTTDSVQILPNSTVDDVNLALNAASDVYAAREAWKDNIDAIIGNPRTRDIEVPDPEV